MSTAADAPTGFIVDEYAPPQGCPVTGCENEALAVGWVDSGGRRIKAIRPCGDCQTRTPGPRTDRRTGRLITPKPSTGYGALYLVPDYSTEADPIPMFSAIAFGERFALLCRRFRRKVDDKDLLDGYLRRLRGRVTSAQMEAGIAQAFNAAQTFPTPDELLAMCLGTWQPRSRGYGRW